ncbi:MAG: hypothetical protein NMK33_02310 [Candidatus Cardinium sp.]|nr:MAG: hypothetical protein NMK33_02310 [Candidatus Cardinium sp.]
MLYLYNASASMHFSLWITCWRLFNVRPSAKPICDQQFLGEAQSSTAAY